MTKRKASVALETGNESNQSSSTQDNNSNSTSATNTTTGTGNNQGGQNGSSAAGSCSGQQQGQQQIGDDNSGKQQKNKKERADNWSSAEIQVLHRGIESRRDIFYGPPNQGTKKNRELAWEAITKEVNFVSTTPRSLSQVMKKFKNEKCRAKRKFIDADKDGHNSLHPSNVNNNSITTTNNNTNHSAQNNTNNNQQLQSHHMTSSESMSSQPSSINVVKLAPQNVAKTMIDLPGHVQQIQMPNDDMVLIVPPEMDGLLSGMNIVSDALNNQQHNHQGHTIQAINTGQGLGNGNMSNGMMARTIPAGSMCSLVYSTGGDVCGSEQHLANSVTNPNSLSSNHISVNAQNLMHHRGSVEQNQNQQQQHQHHHQLHQHQQQQQQAQHQQQPTQSQHQHQSHQPAHHHQHHLQQNHLTTSTTTIANTGGGVAVESQLKNLLFNLLLKDGQHSVPVTNSNQDYNKQRNDMLAIIASSLNKIEGHLSKISKVASSLFAQNMNSSSNDSNVSTSATLNQVNSLNISNNDSNNNSVNMTGTGSTNNINDQSGTGV